MKKNKIITIQKQNDTVLFTIDKDILIGSLSHLRNIIAHNIASLGDDDYNSLYNKELTLLKTNDAYLLSELNVLPIFDMNLSPELV